MPASRAVLVQTLDESMAQLLPALLDEIPGVKTVLVHGIDQAARYLRDGSPDLIVADLDWPHLFNLAIIKAKATDTIEQLRADVDGLVSIIGLSAELIHSDMLRGFFYPSPSTGLSTSTATP